MKPILNIVILSAVIVLALSGCRDGLSSVENGAPKLPPTETIEMNFSDLEESNFAGSNGESKHVSHAMDLADDLKIVQELFLKLPLELLDAAQEVPSIQNEQNEWVRAYTHQVEEETYKVRLVGTYQNKEKAQWKLYVSSEELNIEDRLFMSGSAKGDSMSGSWTLYNLQDSDSPPEKATIEWELQENRNRDMRVTITSEMSHKQGDHIDYSVDHFVKTVAYYNAHEDVTTEVQVNIRNNIGYIIADNYQEGRQSCWNKQFMDVPCGDL